MSEKLKTAVYCRLAVVDEAAMTAFVMIREHYSKLIKSHENWEFAGIYVDDGAGNTTSPRPELKRLLEACREGKIDLVITKNVSRLYRNVTDVVNLARELRSLTPPVGIYFEENGIHTLDTQFDNLLAYMAQVAIEESRLKHQRLPRAHKRYDYPFKNIKRRQSVDYLTPAARKGEA